MAGFEIDGESCWFVSQERMVSGMENNEFLDVDEHDNYLFGTSLESVRNIMAENKLCVLDVRPEVSTSRHAVREGRHTRCNWSSGNPSRNTKKRTIERVYCVVALYEECS